MTLSEDSSSINQTFLADVPGSGAGSDPDLGPLALECAQRADGDINEGATLVLQILRTKHPAYYADLSARVLHPWAVSLIRESATKSRARIAAIASNGAGGVFSAESMARFSDTFFKWQVLPGIDLRDATRKHLDQASGAYLKQARTNEARGQWLAAISAKLPNDTKKVSDVLTEKQVADLAKKFEVAK